MMPVSARHDVNHKPEVFMINTSVRFFLASLAAGSLLTVAAPAMAYDHLLSADDFITNAVINETGSDCVINWTPGAYEGHTLGAGFFTAVLTDAMGWASSDVQAHWGFFCPSSPNYYTAIGAGTYFIQITRAVDIQVGDVLVINSTAGTAGSYSGHTVMITALPTVISPSTNPVVAGTTQWRLPITDSTTSPHGCTDSRYIGTCTPTDFHPGAGTGQMRIYTDTTTGDLRGYTWSLANSTTSYFAPEVRPYRVGRPDGLMGPAPIIDN
jgi:hypothetical protein